MKLYKLHENSKSYVTSLDTNENVYTEEEIIQWAIDIVDGLDSGVRVRSAYMAIEVLDRAGEYLNLVN